MVAEIQKLIESCAKTEDDILSLVKNPIDDGVDWLGKGTYIAYYAIGQYLRPKSIVEIGVRYGYSLESMRRGSGETKHIFCFDNEQDCLGSGEYVFNKLKDVELETLDVINANTQAINSLNINMKIDLGHIDGCHTFDGVYHDCILVSKVMKRNGVILVDDVLHGKDSDEVRWGVDKFCWERDIKPMVIECHRGLYVIQL
jgi:predicted O-methyltransferase YrrM